MRSLARVLVSLALLALLAVAWGGQWAFQFVVPRAAGGWQLVGATAVLFMLWLGAAGRAALSAEPSGAPWTGRREWVAAGALCALGVVFRVVHFSSVPAGMNHDAAFNGMYALSVLQGAPYTPYVSAAWGRETLFMYLCTPLVAWFGNVPEPIQVAATVVAVATLPIFYLLARELCGRRVALVALAFLAVSGWHGVFSRVGWRMIMVPAFEMLALLGLWRALRTGARRDWMLAGAGAALAIYTYDAGRLVLPMVAVLFVVYLLGDRRRQLGPRLRGAVIILATFAIVGAPMLWYAATHVGQFTARAAHLAVEEPRTGVLPPPVAAAAMFNYRGNGNDFFIEEPLLEPLAGALFAFGMLVVLLRALSALFVSPAMPDAPQRTWLASFFVLSGFAVALLPGVLSIPNGNRCIAALPFVYLIIAAGADAVVETAARALPAGTPRRLVVPLLLGILVAVAGVETYREYLGSTRRPILGFSPEATAAGTYLRQFGDEYTRYVVAEDWPEYTLAYLSYNGGGTPLENHYVLGRRLDDIEERINRFGRKGLVFLTDMKPAGREALARLEGQFAEHRIEAVSAPRLGGAQVATALIVAPRDAADPAAPAARAGNAFDGGRGDAPGRFAEPIGVAVDAAGDLYVADRDNHRIQQFTRDGSFVRAWGRQGSAAGEFREPHDVAVDGELVYVADLWNQRVQGFDHDGGHVFTITGTPSFASPRGLFVRDGLIYVAEAGGGRVTVYDRSGTLRQTIGVPDGDAPGHLVEPVDVALDSRGDIWVVNSGNNRLERFAPDGTPRDAIRIPGWSSPHLKEVSLAIDGRDTMYLSDWDQGAVRRFRPDGTELPPLGQAIRQPSGVALDGDRVLVAARGDDVIRVLPLNDPGGS